MSALLKVDPSLLQVGSLRTGEIGLQALKLDPSALEVLRQDPVQIQLRLSGESVIVGHRNGRGPPAYTAAADDFLAVEARITTKSGTSSLLWPSEWSSELPRLCILYPSRSFAPSPAFAARARPAWIASDASRARPSRPLRRDRGRDSH